MLNKSALVLLLSGLASCGTVTADGSTSSGSRGLTQLLTQDVLTAAETGIAACADAKTIGAPLSNLQARGFVPWRGGYLSRIDNPYIFAGNSAVSVRVDRQNECRVKVGPVSWDEAQTLRSVAARILRDRGAAMDGSFVQRSDHIEVVLE